MPALLPHAKPDKAMSLDLQALQNANAAPAATQASSAPAQPPAPEDTDFAEPQNPWVAQEPKATAVPAAPQSAASAPAAASSQAAPAPARPQNPWAALQSNYPARPSGPPQQQPAQSSAVAAPAPSTSSSKASTAAAHPQATASSAKAAPAAPAASSSAVAAPPAPAASSSATAPAAQPRRQCFTNGEGVKICYMQDEQHYNTTDVHKEGGVNDYHNNASASSKEGIQGHIPGKNVTDALNHLGQHPQPNEHKDGNTAFQGQSNANMTHTHDIHKDKTTFTDHEDNAGNMDEDWKSAYKGPHGSKEMSEIDKDGQFKDTSDTKVDAQGKDKLDSEEWRGSNDHRFMSDKPGTKDDSSLIWEEDQERKKQREEFQGKGVYDLHEETSSHDSVKAKVDGDQGWAGFEQSMNDFDNFFNGDKEWTKKMQDPHGKRDESSIAETTETAQTAEIAQEAGHHKGDGKVPWWWQAYVGAFKPPGAAFWTSYWPYKTKRSIDGIPADDAVAMAAKGIDLAGVTKRDDGGKCDGWEWLCDFAEWVGQRPVVGREDKRDLAAVKRDLIAARDHGGKCYGWEWLCDFAEWVGQRPVVGREQYRDDKRDVDGHHPKHGGYRDNGDFEDIAKTRLHDRGDAAEDSELQARGCLPGESGFECACRLDPAMPDCGLLYEIGMRDLDAVEAESQKHGGPHDNGDFEDIAKTRLHDRGIWKRGADALAAESQEHGGPHDNGDFEDIAGTRLHDRRELDARQLVDPVYTDDESEGALWSFACCSNEDFVPYTKPCPCGEKPELGPDGMTKQPHATDRAPSTGHRRSIEARQGGLDFPIEKDDYAFRSYACCPPWGVEIGPCRCDEPIHKRDGLAGVSNGFTGIGSVGSSSDSTSDSASLGARPLDMLGLIFFVVVAAILLGIFSFMLGRRVRMWLQRRRERMGRERYMREIEGCHVVDFSGERWRQGA